MCCRQSQVKKVHQTKKKNRSRTQALLYVDFWKNHQPPKKTETTTETLHVFFPRKTPALNGGFHFESSCTSASSRAFEASSVAFVALLCALAAWNRFFQRSTGQRRGGLRGEQPTKHNNTKHTKHTETQQEKVLQSSKGSNNSCDWLIDWLIVWLFDWFFCAKKDVEILVGY